MAGPRSRGCRLCKIRKIKCDEKWPVCSPCHRQNLACPGQAPWVSLKGKPTEPRSSQVAIRSRSSVPRAPPSTAGDRVAAQLVNHLNAGANRGRAIQARYLGEMPKRVCVHQSLRDSVSLFYVVLTNFLFQKPAVDFTGLPEYGRAIKSLRLILASNEARTPETLASVTVLQLVEELFNPSQRRMLHASGMTSLVTAIGPPKPDDKFYISILSEIPHAITRGWQDSMNKDSWRDPMGITWSKSNVDKELTESMLPVLHACASASDRTPVHVRGCQALWKPSAGKYLEMSNTELGKEILETAENIDTLLAAMVDKCIERGDIVEEEDPHSLSGTSYSFSSPFLAYTLLHAHCSHVFLSQMRYHWSQFHNWPVADTHYTKLKDLCVHIWKYLRFLRRLEPSVAAVTPRGVYLTLELADETQREHLLDEFTELDRALGKILTPRAVMVGEILFFAKLWTGRRP
ncbi:unnamed protein product [Clonostachys chloroleuca]|uniref:Zn(2)-C6 fungal-type domain-containing protein n=1 Tax=Clonostachys chloroleuca TaxID=1926264 RepID=A0AA35Q575_9HYPO|nr:unnamed protein product [Clonostachys chloroleuca]